MLKPAFTAFAIAFAAGFVLAPLRILVLSPRIGEVAAVLCELPIILTASYFIWRWVIRRFERHATPGRRLAIGFTALAMLLLAEFTLSLLLGNAPREFIAKLQTPAGALGLAGQVVFALIPLVLIRARANEKGPAT